MKFVSLFLVLVLTITQVFSDDLENFKTLILDEIKTLKEENTQLNETLNKYDDVINGLKQRIEALENIQGKKTDIQTDKTFTTFKSVWSIEGAPNFKYAFEDLPKEGNQNGWDLVHDGCNDNTDSFPGTIYAPDGPSDNAYPEFFLIYDKNNKIAGMHSVVPSDEKLGYSIRSKWYREFPNIQIIQNYKGKKIFVTTAYFVDPKLICKDGGSQKGLGDRLLFQNGASINDVLTAPLKQTDADSDAFWIKNKCHPTMGLHYFSKDVSDYNSTCNNLTPFQLLYVDGKLSGFIFQHVAQLTGKRWETAIPPALKQIMNTPADCLLKLAGTKEKGFKDNKIKTMHVFLRGHNTTCE